MIDFYLEDLDDIRDAKEQRCQKSSRVTDCWAEVGLGQCKKGHEGQLAFPSVAFTHKSSWHRRTIMYQHNSIHCEGEWISEDRAILVHTISKRVMQLSNLNW